ncbi:MAG: sigma-70 family RNA polymerase sigma factor [Solimonas sp.]
MSDTALSSTVAGSLYREHHRWLHQWLRRKLGCAEQAADLAHDTFVRLIASRRETFGTEPRALLTHVARGLVIDHWRRQEVERVWLQTLAQQPEPLAPSPEDRLLIVEALCRVDAMLRRMPAGTREIFLLAQIDGLRYAEIARRKGVSLITVKRRMREGFLACMTLD